MQGQKFDDIVILCIFMGYGDEEFGYRLWDLEKNRIIRSRDVVFHEQETMSNSIVPEKTSESGGKVDFTPIFLPRENAAKGKEFQEHDVDEEPAIDGAGDRGGVE